MTIAMKINNTFADLLPPLSTEEFAALEVSILAEGCREPLRVEKPTSRGVLVPVVEAEAIHAWRIDPRNNPKQINKKVEVAS
jgi:hypothetical protein